MLNKDIPCQAMLEADELHRLWATSADYTLYCGPGTEREAAILKARYPRHRGAIELGGIYTKPGMMVLIKEQSESGGVLPPSILLGG